MHAFPDFSEDDIEEDVMATEQAHTLQRWRRAVALSTGTAVGAAMAEGTRRTRVGYATWRVTGEPVVLKEVHLPAEDTFSDVEVVAARLLALEAARPQAEGYASQEPNGDDARSVRQEAWPLVRYLALHLDDPHHYQWILGRAGLATLMDAMLSQAAAVTTPTSTTEHAEKGKSDAAGGLTLLCPLVHLPQLTEDASRFVMFSLLRALRTLHDDLGFDHGDVSPSNVLLSLSEDGGGALTRVVLGDLEGLSPRCTRQRPCGSQRGTSPSAPDGQVFANDEGCSSPWSPDDDTATAYFRGAPLYAPLEVLTASETHQSCGLDADIWAAGILLFQLLAGRGPGTHPFYDADKGPIVHGGSVTEAADKSARVSNVAALPHHERFTVLGLIDAMQRAKASVLASSSAIPSGGASVTNAPSPVLWQILREQLPAATDDAVLVVCRCLDWQNQWSAAQLLQLEWFCVTPSQDDETSS